MGISAPPRRSIASIRTTHRRGQAQEPTMREQSVKEAAIPRRQHELAGKTAVVTGSTSGIGLGIAQAFAATGMHVMLNGFGERAEIQKIRADMEEAYGIKTAYSAADMSKPDDIVRMVED